MINPTSKMDSDNTPNPQPIAINISTLNVCRICLQTGNLQPFKKSSIYTTFINILYFSGTKSNHEEDLPQNICKHCVSELKNIGLFIEKVKNNTKTLKEIYKNVWNMRMDEENSPVAQDSQMKEESSDGITGEEIEDRLSSEEHIIFEVEIDEDAPSMENTLEDDSTELPEIKLFSCGICDKIFTFQTSWKYHMSTHPEVKLWECSSCEWAGLEETLLEVHVKNAHENEGGESSVDYTQIDQTFLCNICGQSFLQKSLLEKHLEIHEHEKYHECKVCGLKFILESTLSKHMDVHLQKNQTYCCNLCGKSFTKKCFLDTHIAIFHGPKQTPPNPVKKPSLLCSNCGKRYPSEKSLQKHSETCEDEFSLDKFLCVHCGKEFTFKVNLNRHILISHSAQKRFSCKVCGEKFTVKNSLKYHMNIHSDSKPYQCTVCSRGFRQPSALIRHKSTVHTKEKKAQCTICYKWLKSDETLKSHMKRHSEEN